MKIIKFTPELTLFIKSGKKTRTFRLFDDKDLTKGDRVILATRDGEKVTDFAEATLTEVYAKKLKDLNNSDYVGHETINLNPVEDYKKYYGDKVTAETEVKIVTFKVLKYY